MIIELTPDFRVTSDVNNWVLERRSVVESGKHQGEERWTNEGYFNSLEQAAKRCLDKSFASLDMQTDLRSVVDALRIIGGDIAEACRGVERGNNV